MAPSTCISHLHMARRRSSSFSKICALSRIVAEKHGVLRSYTNLIRYTAKPRSGHCWSKLLHPSTYYRKPTHCRGTLLTLRPNHEELLAIYDQPCTISTFQELQEVISPLIHHLLDVVGVGQSGGGAVVVRCGRHGSCVGTQSKGIKWFPAFFTEMDSGRVVDVSGGMSPRMIGDNKLTNQLATRT